MKKKARPNITVNNKIPEYGTEQGGKIVVNVKKHKGNKAELIDTVKHELLHAKHPKAKEEVIRHKTKEAVREMSFAEKQSLVAKLRSKHNHYAQGVIKRKLQIHGKTQPGSLISAMNEQKVARKPNQSSSSNFKLGVEGLI